MKGLRLIFFDDIPALVATKLTWFMKGLRHEACVNPIHALSGDQIDLIYEGIETTHIKPAMTIGSIMDQIDLIYEGIETWTGKVVSNRYRKDQIDLIYEGIETLSEDQNWGRA